MSESFLLPSVTPSDTAGAVSQAPAGKVSSGIMPVAMEWDSVTYFREFNRIHSGSTGPVLTRKSMLLFPDGWQHSAWDYKGPEVPPPEDPEELARLQLRYWALLSWQVKAEIRRIVRQRESLEEMARNHGAPLQVRFTVWDPEQGQFRTVSDPAVLDGRLIWLRGMLDQCSRALRELLTMGRPAGAGRG